MAERAAAAEFGKRSAEGSASYDAARGCDRNTSDDPTRDVRKVKVKSEIYTRGRRRKSSSSSGIPVGIAARLGFRAAALHRTAARRCRAHGPSAYAQRRAPHHAREDRRTAGDSGFSPIGKSVNSLPAQFTFLITRYGGPFNPIAFSTWFRDQCDRAGLRHCSAHGLRKAAARRLAEAGCSANEIGAITGHATLKEIGRYTAAADQRRLALSAMNKIRT